MQPTTSPSAPPRRGYQQALFLQISLAIAALAAVLGPLQYFVLRWSLARADDVLLQRQMWDVARNYVNVLELHRDEPLLLGTLRTAVRELSRLNPVVDVYLIGEHGDVVHSFAEILYTPRRKHIAVEPILRFLEPESSRQAPLRGDDPDDDRRSALFSAAPLTLQGQRYYLYVVISGARRRHAYQLYSENYLAQYFSISSTAGIVAVLFLGSFLFVKLSRRVAKTEATMRAFRDGDYSSRIRSDDPDELGELARTFDEMADRIARSVRDLEKRDALRRELIATISHDLRGPVGNIMVHVERMQEESTGTTDRASLDTVQRNAGHLAELLSQLFELASLEAKEVAPQLEDHLLHPLFEDLVISYRPRAEALGIVLDYQIEPPQLVASVDLTMLGRILANLIENALRFTNRAGRISLQANCGGGGVRVSVRDTGVGIAKGDLPKIFDKFFQAGSASAQTVSSCGLGLSIVRRLVELHGSEIHVESTVNEGTEFFFDLAAASPRTPVIP